MVEIEAVTIDALAREKPFIVVGIPAYDEEQTIGRIVLEAKKFADKVIVCNDGSTDFTSKIAESLGADVINHAKNCGYGASIKSLFVRAYALQADIFVTLDADGQHTPLEIPSIIQPIVDGNADIVIGSRFVDKNGTQEMPLYRQFGAKLITKLVNGSSKNGVTDAQSGFRAYGQHALERLNFHESGMGASVEILLNASKNALRIVEIPSTCKYNNCNVSTSSKHPVAHGIGVVMSLIRIIVEERPLVMLGVPGLLCLFAGMGFGLWMLQIYSLHHVIVTNIALASFAFVLIGFFLLSTSITLYAITRISSKIRHSE